MSPHLLDWLRNSSLDVAWMCLAALALELVFRSRIGPRWRYLLWSLVLLRVFVP